MVKVITTTIINQGFSYYFQNHTYHEMYMAGDLEYVSMTLKSLLQNYDSLTMKDLAIAISYVRSCIFSHTQIVVTYDLNLLDDFFDMVSRLYGKILYDLIIVR